MKRIPDKIPVINVAIIIMMKHLQNWIQKKIYNKNKIINMVHFLRTEKNITIIECEAWQGDLSAATNINEYSKMLLWIHSEDKSKTQDFINDFSNLDSTGVS